MSPIGSLFDIGVRGIQRGLQDAQAAAETVAGVGSEAENTDANASKDMLRGMVELLKAENQVKRSARVVQTGSEILGTIIDDVV